jgi:hypothetical protein
MRDKLFWFIIKYSKKGGGKSETLAKGVNTVKKMIALFVSSIFAFSLGIAYAEEENIMPWQRNVQTSAKKEDKARTKAIKTNKKEAKKAKVEKAKKTHIAKAEKTSMEKAKKTDTEKVEHNSTAKEEKKETGQKKKFLFW